MVALATNVMDAPSAQASDPSQPLGWRDWFAEHGRKLFLFARQQTRSEEDAKDVLQDAVVRSWRSFNGAEGEAPPLALAYAMIRRAAIDHARKNQRRQAREERAAEMEREERGGHDWFEPEFGGDSDRTLALKKALSEIPDKFREVITLKVWGGLTFDQIGESLNIPLNTAASRYRYGLEALRKKLPRHPGESEDEGGGGQVSG
ncbi:MAG: RNA polymerase sigma factor [Verrucomicrobiales bacterium]